MKRIWAAILTGFLSILVLPAAAWAEQSVQSGLADELRRRPGIGFFGGGVLCCLLVVAGIVLVIFLVTRNRR
jgi:hypothetical protein